MTPLLVAMPGNERLTEDLAATLRWDVGRLEIRAFPDGETYLRFITNPANRSVALSAHFLTQTRRYCRSSSPRRPPANLAL